MKRNVYYCEGWFRGKKIATGILSADEARKAHDRKQSYTALIDSVERPYCFVEMAGAAVIVGFLDELLRESLTYVFQEVDSEKLFLSTAT